MVSPTTTKEGQEFLREKIRLIEQDKISYTIHSVKLTNISLQHQVGYPVYTIEYQYSLKITESENGWSGLSYSDKLHITRTQLLSEFREHRLNQILK